MFLVAFRKYAIGEREDVIWQDDGIIHQPCIIKREATEQEYEDYWKGHPDYIPGWKERIKNDGRTIVAFYEVYTD